MHHCKGHISSEFVGTTIFTPPVVTTNAATEPTTTQAPHDGECDGYGPYPVLWGYQEQDDTTMGPDLSTHPQTTDSGMTTYTTTDQNIDASTTTTTTQDPFTTTAYCKLSRSK